MGQIIDLIKPIEDMSDDELRQKLIDLRHRRETIRPSAAHHKEKAVKKLKKVKSSKEVKAAKSAIAGMTSEQIELLLKEMAK